MTTIVIVVATIPNSEVVKLAPKPDYQNIRDWIFSKKFGKSVVVFCLACVV